jgi:hypothetical protein
MVEHGLSTDLLHFGGVPGTGILFPDSAFAIVLADALGAACWILANILLGTACWRAARRLFPESTGAELVLHCLVLAWSGVLSVLLILGIFGLLTGFLATATVAALSAAVHLCLRGRGRGDSSGFTDTQHGFAFRTAFPRDGGAVSRLTGARAVSAQPFSIGSAVWWLVLPLGVGHVLVNGLLVFPRDWDTLYYHLPMIDQWLQARCLYTPDCWHWSYPGNHELFGLWAIAPFSGDFFNALNNLPAAALLAVAMICLGGEVGLSRPFAHLAGIAAVSNYVVLCQLVDNENDVAVAALFFTGFFYGLRFLRSRRQADLMLCSVVVGLLAGVKFYALGYAILVGGVLILFAFLAWGPGAVLQAGAALLGGMVLFGGYWYFRNAWVSGSPLYPRDLWQAEDMFSRLYPGAATSSFIGNGQPEVFGLAVKAVWGMTGPCHLLALLLLPITLPYLALAGIGRRDQAYQGIRRVRGAIVLLTVGAATLLLLTPFAVEDTPGTLNQVRWGYCPVRYGLCFLTLAVFVLLVVLQDAAGRLRRFDPYGAAGHILVGLLAVGCAIQFTFTDERLPRRWDDTILAAVLLLLVAVIVVLIRHLWPATRKVLVVGVGLGAVAGFSLFTGSLAATWHLRFTAHYDHYFGTKLYRRMAAEIPSGSRICVMETQCFPFFGSARQFRVCQPVYTASPEELGDYLHQHDTDYVAVPPGGHISETFFWFNELKSQHPDAFPAVWDDPLLPLYRRADKRSPQTARQRESNGQPGEGIGTVPTHSPGIEGERP